MRHVAQVVFDLPDDVTGEEISQVHTYLFEAVAAHRFGTKKPGPWKMSNVSVEFDQGTVRAGTISSEPSK